MPIINISQIKIPELSELNSAKLHALEHSFNSFETQLNSRIDPIALDVRGGTPYGILNGRHRVYLANQKGIKQLNVDLANKKLKNNFKSWENQQQE